MIRPDPVGRLLFNVLAVVAEFESDLIRLGTREGMTVAKAKGTITWQATKVETEPGQAPARTAQLRELHQG
jgi:DNA invertase Pin-like site-specific DNA recombinase